MSAPVPPVTRWYWVRHAPVTANKGCVYGQDDMPCDCADPTSFAFLAERLPREAVWVASNLRRTHETAAAIVAAGLAGPAAIPGPDLLIERDLAEQHFGEWQGKRYDELPGLLGEAYFRFWLAPARHAPPGGESFAGLMERVAPVIERLNRDFAGRNIIAVTHGGTIRAALALALGLTPESALSFSIANCSLTRIERHDGANAGHGWRVVSVNETAGSE